MFGCNNLQVITAVSTIWRKLQSCMNTVKTNVEEPSDLRTYRLKLGILIPKYIRTYPAWQRKTGSYTKKHSYFIAKILDFNC